MILKEILCAYTNTLARTGLKKFWRKYWESKYKHTNTNIHTHCVKVSYCSSWEDKDTCQYSVAQAERTESAMVLYVEDLKANQRVKDHFQRYKLECRMMGNMMIRMLDAQEQHLRKMKRKYQEKEETVNKLLKQLKIKNAQKAEEMGLVKNGVVVHHLTIITTCIYIERD